jgi:hypothetical protein
VGVLLWGLTCVGVLLWGLTCVGVLLWGLTCVGALLWGLTCVGVLLWGLTCVGVLLWGLTCVGVGGAQLAGAVDRRVSAEGMLTPLSKALVKEWDALGTLDEGDTTLLPLQVRLRQPSLHSPVRLLSPWRGGE